LCLLPLNGYILVRSDYRRGLLDGWIDEGDEDNNQVEVVSAQLVHIFHAWQDVFQVNNCLLRHHLSPLMVHYCTGPVVGRNVMSYSRNCNNIFTCYASVTKDKNLGASHTNIRIENMTENVRNIVSCKPYQTSSLNVWGQLNATVFTVDCTVNLVTELKKKPTPYIWGKRTLWHIPQLE
jgi:hypothetical protein